MYLIAVLLALVALQIWGARNPLHRDGWFFRWSSAVARLPGVVKSVPTQLVLTLALPVAAVVAASVLLPPFLWFVLAVIVLLYSLGRGEFAPDLHAYALACSDNAWPVAVAKARLQGADTGELATGDWPSLNQKMLEAAAYQGFERLFAVLFWFMLFGPAGALMYRLLFIYHQSVAGQTRRQRLSERCLWALEWPVARVLGFSFAITGNFVGCVNRWRRQLVCIESTSATVLRECVLGALSVDDELMHSCDCTQREVAALKRLYARTLWFWVGCLAMVTLVY